MEERNRTPDVLDKRNPVIQLNDRFRLPVKVVEEWNCTPVDVLDKRNLVLSHHAVGFLCQQKHRIVILRLVIYLTLVMYILLFATKINTHQNYPHWMYYYLYYQNTHLPSFVGGFENVSW